MKAHRPAPPALPGCRLWVPTLHASCRTRACARRRRGPLPPLRAAADGGGGGLFGSDVVQSEALDIMKAHENLAKLLPKFADFDTEGKRLYIEQLEALCERLRIFTARARLAGDSDAASSSFLNNMNVQLLHVDTNLDALYASMDAQCSEMRRIVAAEEACGSPEALAAFRRRLAAEMAAGRDTQERLAKNLNMEALMKDPESAAALMDPLAMAALRDVMADPKSMERYRDNPKLFRLLTKVFG